MESTKIYYISVWTSLNEYSCASGGLVQDQRDQGGSGLATHSGCSGQLFSFSRGSWRECVNVDVQLDVNFISWFVVEISLF